MSTNRLRDYLADHYDGDPLGVVRFVNRTCRLVRVVCHYWRGRRKMQSDAAVSVGGVEVGRDARTEPTWKFLPDKMQKEFAAFDRSVKAVIRDMCISGTGNDDSPLVFGEGVYAVDTSVWPTAEIALERIRSAWGAAGDRWCTEDGYQEIHDLLKSQIGDADYERVKNLVPPREILRGKFWLEVRTLPFRLTEEVSGADDERDRRSVTVDLIEAAVREPREYAAETWRGLAAQMAESDPSGTRGLVARQKTRKHPTTGLPVPTSRTVAGDSVALARRGLDVFERSRRFHDPASSGSAALVAAELPSDSASQKRVATTWNGSDEEALRVSSILFAAAEVLTNEANMVIGVSAALSARP